MYLNIVVDTMAITDGSSLPQQVKLDTPLSSGLRDPDNLRKVTVTLWFISISEIPIIGYL